MNKEHYIDPNPKEVPRIYCGNKYKQAPEPKLTTIESIMDEFDINEDFTLYEGYLPIATEKLIKEVVRLRNIKTKKEVLSYNNNIETYENPDVILDVEIVQY